MLSRSGFLIPKTDDVKEHKKVLTVRPEVNTEYGFQPPSFKVFRQSKQNICVPRYYGQEAVTQFTDKRPEPAQMNVEFKGKLRDSTRQNESFSKTVAAMHKTGGGILSLPCGYGKTTIALAVAAHMGVRTMIIVHKEFLANQWRERIKQFCPGASIGIVQQNKIETDCDFVVAMLQSISMKDYELNTFEKIGMVIVDEAHHICARVFSQALFKFCPKYSLGLSATPDRKDGLTNILYWFLGPQIVAIERESRGKVIVKSFDFECDMYTSPPPTTRFGKIALPQMITDLTLIDIRNDFVEQVARKYSKQNRRILILSDRRIHCEHMAERLEDIGVGLYMGGMKEAQLSESAKQNIIIGTFSQAHEGLDIPVLDTVILATPKSDVKQAVGRILRETDGKKNDPVIIDIKDKWGNILPSMYYKRRAMYKSSNFELEKDKDEEKAIQNSLKGYSFL
jgi:superfamily II DNA or RNA helicase